MNKLIHLSLAALIAAGPLAALAAEKEKTVERTRTTTADGRTVESETRQIAPRRLSMHLNLPVYNNENKQIGVVHDLVLDGGSDCISYAVLSYGGFLGMGDKLFAIPWSSLEYRPAETDRVFLAIPEQRLKDAPGFDKSNWPDAGDKTYRTKVDAYYESDLRKDKSKDKPKDNRTLDEKRSDAAAPRSQGLLWTRRASQIIGADVKNLKNENIGTIKDLIIDTNTGKVPYAVLSFGGVMGMGNKLFAIPTSQLRSKSMQKELVLDISTEDLKNSPGFEDSKWPDWTDEQYRMNVDKVFKGRVVVEEKR